MGMASFSFSVALAVLSLLSLRTEAAQIFLDSFCPKNTTFTPNSTFQSNLNNLLSSFSSNARSQDGFYKNSVGQNASNSVYGLLLCKGDLNVQDCQDCVGGGIQDLTLYYCPIEKEAMIYYEDCILRYSNRYFFSSMNTQPSFARAYGNNVSDPDRFNQLVMETMKGLVIQVANVGIGAKKFGTKEGKFNGSQIIYTMGQCTPDISSSDCRLCMQEAIAVLPQCCGGNQGARVVFPSCRVRYDTYPFYIKQNASTPMPAILTPAPSGSSQSPGKRKIPFLGIIGSIVAAATGMLVVGFYLRRRRNASRDHSDANDDSTVEKLVDSLQFDLATIEAATDKFSENNKLGAGGFGKVYKGVLLNGQEIAAKRLSRCVGQGYEEFKNEVVLVSKLQHRNLVRLLGFCMEGEEKILVYEFVPNKSLDHFLYGVDPEKQQLLSWASRYKIIEGIARGILYLHEDSHIKIIHRDLKASNILLDESMNPKIADFGTSKLFEVDQTQGNTSRIIGTYGYMAPEYAKYGRFSVKSDVFGFGIIVLEILSGKKNNFISYQTNSAEGLPSYAWKLWKDGKPLELLDSSVRDSYSVDEVIKCIHIGLLCVQENPVNRPTMASILLMLKSSTVTLQQPQEPAFVLHRGTGTNMPTKDHEPNQSSSKSSKWSYNGATITELDPR